MSSIEKAMERLTRQADAKSRGERALLPASAVETETVDSDIAAEVKQQVELNFKALAQAGYLTVETMGGRLAEQYRVLKWPVLKNASARDDPQDENNNLIAVSSALPREGKTFTSFNLAMSLAMERDVTVLLVDCDLLARSLTQLVGLDDAPGLTDMLVDRKFTLGDVIVRTNVPKLRVMPAGRVRQHTTELLASEQMRNVVGELSTRYQDRLVLFDTAPILTTSQASVLDALVGQVLLVVEEGKTPQHALQDAVTLLDKNKAIGLVLNKSVRSFKHEYGPYYGGYYYGAS